MFHNIIVGVDGSEASMRAVQAACQIADTEARIWLVHTPVAETVAFATGAVAGYHMVTMMQNEKEVQEAADRIIKSATDAAVDAGGQIAGNVIRRGDPGDEILAEAKDKNADLIVTGRRGLGNIAGLLIGSTSQRISHLATCAVLTVP